MSKVVYEMTVSQDGYVTGPDVGEEFPLGRGGESLHDWMFEGRSGAEIREFQVGKYRDFGAVIVGRRMADLGIPNWGGEPVFHAPVFVVTHRPAETIVKEGGTSYEFVTDGIEATLEQAREAAGGADVKINGGADIGRQYLDAGLVDALWLHYAPILLGGGTPLFGEGATDLRLEPVGAEPSPLALHVTYRVAA
jgi:dihydrofolate reductase